MCCFKLLLSCSKELSLFSRFDCIFYFWRIIRKDVETGQSILSFKLLSSAETKANASIYFVVLIFNLKWTLLFYRNNNVLKVLNVLLSLFLVHSVGLLLIRIFLVMLVGKSCIDFNHHLV